LLGVAGGDLRIGHLKLQTGNPCRILASLLRRQVDELLDRDRCFLGPAKSCKPNDDIDHFILALKDLNISAVWIQLFSRSGDFDKKNAKLRMGLIDRLGKAGIRWTGWGYCAGRNAKTDIKLISDLKKDLGIEAFIIDAARFFWFSNDFIEDSMLRLESSRRRFRDFD